MSTQPRNRPAHSGRLAQRHQSGSILVQFALLSTVILAILATVQVGYMYYAKRDLQRIADLAALEAVNALTYGDSSTCNRAETAGNRSVTEQLHIALDGPAPRIECGNWNASRADAQRFLGHGGANPLNAARVTLEGQTLQLFPGLGDRTISAQAIASKNSEPIAAFSVGSQLLQFNNDRLLGKITEAVGLDITRLTILDKNGIANAKITPSGLLQFLGLPVGVSDLALLTPNDVANVEASLLDLIDAAVNAAGNDVLNAGVDIGALQALRAYVAAFPLANIKVPLAGDNGIFAFINAGSNSSPLGNGLDVILDVADLVRTQIAIANGENTIALNLGVLNLINIDLTVVEPPTIAIGPANGNIKARSAQVRLALHIGGDQSKNVALGLFGLLGTLGVNINLDLPIQLDVVRSTGTLEKIQCTASQSGQTVNISVNSAVGDVCIGKLDESWNCQDADLVHVKLLHDSILNMTLRGHLTESILQSSGSSLSHPPNPVACPFESSDECLVDLKVGDKVWSGPNGLRLGDTVIGLLDSILDLVKDLAKNSQLEGLLGSLLGIVLGLLGILGSVLDAIVDLVSIILTPVLNAVGSILDGVLTGILGVEVGRAEVEVLAIECDTAQLVQ